MTPSAKLSLVGAAIFALASAASANPPILAPNASDVDRIVAEGKDRNQVTKHLWHLTQKIGPRLTGSPGLAKAEAWAVSQFKKFGLKNARLEQWGDVPVGFERGKRQVGRMVTPFLSNFEFTTMNWTPGTKGLVRAEAKRAPSSLDELNANKDAYKGAWIVVARPAGMRGPMTLTDDVNKALDEVGIAGRIFGAPDERVHSSGSWRDKTYEKRPTQIGITVRKEDFDRITRNIDFGRKPVLEFDIENKWIKGPVKQYNVVADIPGTDLKDEIVVVCGHLDSWNSPGSQGTCDNGTGTVAALEAARILMAAKVQPRRTIRFILWSGEEQGLLGSRAYVEANKANIDKFVALLNDDGGTNYQGGYTGLPEHKEILEAAFAPTVKAFPEMPMTFDAPTKLNIAGSSDHAPFAWAGVPAYFTKEVGRSNYGKVWHTQFDRYEFAIPEYLVQSSTNHAVVAYHLATIDARLARFPKTERVAMDAKAMQAVGSDMVYEDHDHDPTKPHDHEDDYVLELIDRLKRTAGGLIRSIR